MHVSSGATQGQIQIQPRVSSLGTDGLDYEPVTLQVSKIGKDKGIGGRNLKKMCDLFKVNTEQTRHIMSSAHPSCLPNSSFKKSKLSSVDKLGLTQS